MKRFVWIGIGVSCLTVAGNAQDSAASSTPASVGVYTTQGSTEYNQTLRDAEQRRRVEQARQMKAIKDSMRTVNPSQVKYTNAEQFLAANRPPMPPAVDPSEQERIRRDNYIPDFQGQQQGPSQPQGGYTAPPPIEYPREEEAVPEKRNFFKWLATQNGKETQTTNVDTLVPTNSSSYEPEGGIDGLFEEEPNTAGVPASEMPQSDSGGFLGKLFGGKKETSQSTPQSLNSPVDPSDLPPVEESLETNDGGGLPEPPAFSSDAPTRAPAVTAPIFVDRSVSGTPITVGKTTQAEVEGVRVMLYEGSTVNLLSKSGSTASIQLPDGRKGTTELSALQ